MKKPLMIAALVCYYCVAAAQGTYAAFLIPKNLLPYASAVVRNEESTVEINSLNLQSIHIKKAVTVLNSNGDREAALNISYDKVRSVKNIHGAIYDEFGNVVRKISGGDFEDEAETDGFSLFEDDRVKRFTGAHTGYPYTIEFEYELKWRQTFILPEWRPQPIAGVAVQQSTFTVLCKPDFKLRYKEIRLPGTVSTAVTKDGKNSFTWHVGSLPARREEPLAPDHQHLESLLVLAPENFAYENYHGTFKNWEQLGKWIFDDFLAGADALPPETVESVHDLTAGIRDPKDKARKIYEFMQQKTHYVSVQVGIGGFRPFAAATVDHDGYGDCKALVNYMGALLKAAGIPSYYCLVYGDKDEKQDLLPDFASQQGNHVILCLPFKNDTTWLECTNQHLPFGYLGDFTDDRTVLACTPEGGRLFKTVSYKTEENAVSRKGDFVLDESGNLQGSVVTDFKGIDYEDHLGLALAAPKERLQAIGRAYPLGNMEVKKLNYRRENGPQPVCTEELVLSASEFGAAGGGKIYFSVNSFDRLKAPFHEVRSRENPIYFIRGFSRTDELDYRLPEGYKLASAPLDISLNKPFGSFTAKIFLKNGQISYERKLQVKEGTYPKELYPDVVDFYQQVEDADNYNVALSRQ